MHLEFHQLDRRWEHLRVRQPHLQRRLMASLAESGQQTPMVVVLSPDHRDRYLCLFGRGPGAEAARLTGTLLAGVSGADPLTFCAVLLVFGFVALIAGAVPGRRAMRVAPMQALRWA